jgi:hypothetical protein
MSSFLESITPDRHTTEMRRCFAKDPFKDLIPETGGAIEFLGFNLDRTFVKSESLKKLKKHVNYVPFAQISSRVRGSLSFTIACVCDIRGDSLLLSDLRSTTQVLIAENAPPLVQWDVIAIANVEIGKKLRVKEAKQIVRIGECRTVEKCTHAGDGGQCCVFVDSRNGPTCDYHCRQLFADAGKNRMFLKQNTRVMVDETPKSSPERFGGVLDREPLAEVPNQYVNEYLENHPHGRAAKFLNALKKKDGPTIGAGFKPGEFIPL